MPSKHQFGTKHNYENLYDRHADLWSKQELLALYLHNKEDAIGYWNAVNRMDRSEQVKDHFETQLKRFK
jgi:hypothetical protein